MKKKSKKKKSEKEHLRCNLCFEKEQYCVIGDLEKVYDRVPREELWYCVRKSGV